MSWRRSWLALWSCSCALATSLGGASAITGSNSVPPASTSQLLSRHSLETQATENKWLFTGERNVGKIYKLWEKYRNFDSPDTLPDSAQMLAQTDEYFAPTIDCEIFPGSPRGAFYRGVPISQCIEKELSVFGPHISRLSSRLQYAGIDPISGGTVIVATEIYHLVGILDDKVVAGTERERALGTWVYRFDESGTIVYYQQTYDLLILENVRNEVLEYGGPRPKAGGPASGESGSLDDSLFVDSGEPADGEPAARDAEEGKTARTGVKQWPILGAAFALGAAASAIVTSTSSAGRMREISGATVDAPEERV